MNIIRSSDSEDGCDMFERLRLMLHGCDGVIDLPDEISDPELRAKLLSTQADEMLEDGHILEAVQCYDAALVNACRLARQHCSDSRHSQMIASLQYCRAGALITLNQHTEAIEALDESERLRKQASRACLISILLKSRHVAAWRSTCTVMAFRRCWSWTPL